jgi:hypothetical protein
MPDCAAVGRAQRPATRSGVVCEPSDVDIGR